MKRMHAPSHGASSEPAAPAHLVSREGMLVPDLARFLSAVASGGCALTRQGEPSRSDTRRMTRSLDSAAAGANYSEFLLFLAIQLDLAERIDGRLCVRPAGTVFGQEVGDPLASCFEAWCRSPFWSERYPRRRIAWCSDQMAFAYYREPLPRYREVALGALRGLPLARWVPFERLTEVARTLGFFADVKWGYREAFGQWEEGADGPQALLARFVQEALLWMGVVNVGREEGAKKFSLLLTADGARLMGHPCCAKPLGAAPDERKGIAG